MAFDEKLRIWSYYRFFISGRHWSLLFDIINDLKFASSLIFEGNWLMLLSLRTISVRLTQDTIEFEIEVSKFFEKSIKARTGRLNISFGN